MRCSQGKGLGNTVTGRGGEPSGGEPLGGEPSGGERLRARESEGLGRWRGGCLVRGSWMQAGVRGGWVSGQGEELGSSVG